MGEIGKVAGEIGAFSGVIVTFTVNLLPGPEMEAITIKPTNCLELGNLNVTIIETLKLFFKLRLYECICKVCCIVL